MPAGVASRVSGSLGLRTGAAADRARARARGLALPLLVLVVPWQAWWRAGFLANPTDAQAGDGEAPQYEEPREDYEEADQLPAVPAASRPGQGATTLPADLLLVVFDLGGTTLDDFIQGEPLAVAAIRSAFKREGLEVSLEAVTTLRGLEKREAIRRLYRDLRGDAGEGADFEEAVDRIHGHFLDAVGGALRESRPREVPGASSTFQALRDRGIAVVISSGFPTQVVYDIVQRLGWEVDGVVPAQPPQPDAVLQAMRLADVREPAQVLKVGDTVADIEEGRRAGAWTATVLTGTQGEAALRAAGPDFVLASVAELPGLLAPEVPQGPPTQAQARAEAQAEAEAAPAAGVPAAPIAPAAPTAAPAPMQVGPAAPPAPESGPAEGGATLPHSRSAVPEAAPEEPVPPSEQAPPDEQSEPNAAAEPAPAPEAKASEDPDEGE